MSLLSIIVINLFLKLSYCELPEPRWESLIFAISNRNLYTYNSYYYNYLCVEKSKHYCLQGYVTSENEDYESMDYSTPEFHNWNQMRLNHTREFRQLIRPSWYSVF